MFFCSLILYTKQKMGAFTGVLITNNIDFLLIQHLFCCDSKVNYFNRIIHFDFVSSTFKKDTFPRKTKHHLSFIAR